MKRFLEIASPEQLYRTFFFKKNYRTVRYQYGTVTKKLCHTYFKCVPKSKIVKIKELRTVRTMVLVR